MFSEPRFSKLRVACMERIHCSGQLLSNLILRWEIYQNEVQTYYDERCLAESGISPLLLVTILYPSYGRRDNSQMKIFRFRVGARF